tara:strand:- start:2204 stop:2623 length:420 start_codon:yes stop_codon:yes gene_type:complete
MSNYDTFCRATRASHAWKYQGALLPASQQNKLLSKMYGHGWSSASANTELTEAEVKKAARILIKAAEDFEMKPPSFTYDKRKAAAENAKILLGKTKGLRSAIKEEWPSIAHRETFSAATQIKDLIKLGQKLYASARVRF